MSRRPRLQDETRDRRQRVVLEVGSARREKRDPGGLQNRIGELSEDLHVVRLQRKHGRREETERPGDRAALCKRPVGELGAVVRRGNRENSAYQLRDRWRQQCPLQVDASLRMAHEVQLRGLVVRGDLRQQRPDHRRVLVDGAVIRRVVGTKADKRGAVAGQERDLVHVVTLPPVEGRAIEPVDEHEHRRVRPVRPGRSGRWQRSIEDVRRSASRRGRVGRHRQLGGCGARCAGQHEKHREHPGCKKLWYPHLSLTKGQVSPCVKAR